MNEPVERDGVHRWIAGMPFVRTLDPSELGPVHHAALRRIRRVTWRTIALAAGFSTGMAGAYGYLALQREMPEILLLALVFLVAPLGLLRMTRVRVGWRVIQMTRRGASAPLVDRYVGVPQGHEAMRMRQLNRAGASWRGKEVLEVDVLRDLSLVAAVNGVAPRGLALYRPHITSDRLQGTAQGVGRTLAAHELLELGDAARHEWTPLLSVALLAAVLLAGGINESNSVLRVLCVGFASVLGLVCVLDVIAAQQRRRLFAAILSDPRVVGGTRKNGQPVEVLMPGKVFWTEGGCPAPDRFRKLSRSLERYLEHGGDQGSGRPTSF